MPVRPSTWLEDPTLRTALNVRSLGGNPLLAGGVRDEAFQRQLGVLGPESPAELLLRQGTRAEERLLAQRNLQGTVFSGETAREVADLRQDRLNQILGLRAPKGGGGGVDPETFRRRDPPPTAPPGPIGTRPHPRDVKAPAPAAGPTLPPELTDLQRALSAADATRRALAQRRQQADQAARAGTSGLLGQDLFQGMPLPGGFRSPEEAFARTLSARREQAFREQTDERMARQALQAFHAGDAGTAERLYEGLLARSVGRMRLNSPRSAQAMASVLNGAGQEVGRYLGYEAVQAKALTTQASPHILERARRMARDGEAPEVVEQFLMQNTETGRAELQRKALGAQRDVGRHAFLDAMGLPMTASESDVLAVMRQDPQRLQQALRELGLAQAVHGMFTEA